MYIYCLWVLGDKKGMGYGDELMNYCIEDAKAKGKSGICMLGADKQKAWLSDQSLAEKFGFAPVDETDYGYKLLALSFDGTKPRFAPSAKAGKIAPKELTVYYSDQCPYIAQTVAFVKKTCTENGVQFFLVHIDSLEKAKNLPCVFNNYAVFYKGNFVTVNLTDAAALKRLLKK